MTGDMDITSVMRKSCINLKLKGRTKAEIVEEMTDLFEQSGVLSDREQFIRDVYLREAEGPTGIGDGVAIPHGKSDAVITTAMAVGRSEEPIEWESMDEKPVRVFVMFAVNSADKSQLVSLLSQVAVALCDEEVIKQLFITKDADEIIDLFAAKGRPLNAHNKEEIA